MGGPIQAILQGVITIFFYAIMLAAVWKLFQIAGDLGEIKTILADVRKNTAAPAAKPAETQFPRATAPALPPVLAGPISLESAEALLREVAAEEHALAVERPRTTA